AVRDDGKAVLFTVKAVFVADEKDALVMLRRVRFRARDATLFDAPEPARERRRLRRALARVACQGINGIEYVGVVVRASGAPMGGRRAGGAHHSSTTDPDPRLQSRQPHDR